MIYNFIDISKPLEFNSIGKFQDNSPDYMHADRPLSNFELIKTFPVFRTIEVRQTD